MPHKKGQLNIGILILTISAFLFAIFIGINVAKAPSFLIFSLVAGIGIGIITLIRIDFALIILIFAMLFSPELAVGEVAGRPIVVRLEDILIIFVFFVWLVKIAVYKELGVLKKTPLNAPLIMYVAASILFTGWAVIQGEVSFAKSAFYILKSIEYFMLYFMTINNLNSLKQAKVFTVFLLVVCLLVCIYGLSHIGRQTRLTAPFEGKAEPNTLAGYLLLMLGVSLGIWLYADRLSWKFSCVCLSLFILPVFLFTLSRGGYVAAVFLYLSLIILSKKKRTLLIGILMLLIIITPMMLPLSVLERIRDTFKYGTSYNILGEKVTLARSAAARVDTWRNAVSFLKKRPVFGAGVTGVGFVDSQFVLILGELGLAGLIVFLWLLIVIWQSSKYAFKESRDNWAKGLALGYRVSFIGILVQSIGANVFIIVRIMEPFWFLTAIIVMLPQLTDKETKFILEGT